MSAVTLFSDFNSDSVNETSVRHLDTGGKMVWLNHTGPGADTHSGPIILQTSQMRSPSGIRCWENDGAPPKYSMELVLDPSSVEYRKLAEFDKRILDIACETKNKWIKRASREVLDALYNPTVRVPRDKETDEVTDKWPVTFKVTIPQRNGAFQCELWDSRRNVIDIMDFVKSGAGRNATVTVITQCTGIWVAGGKFGTTWKAQQILVHSTSNSTLRSFAFIGGSDMLEDDEGAHAPAAAPTPRGAPPGQAAASGRAGGRQPGFGPPATAAARASSDDDGEYLDESD